MKEIKFFFLFAILIFSSSFILFKKKGKPMTYNLKMIEKSLGEIKPNLYASHYEVNNLFYHDFLNDLRKQNKAEALVEASINNEKWREIVLGYGEPFISTYSDHPAYNSYPVLNISHEGARLFCNWLTEKYNKEAKRKFKEVLFRLPTEEEWKHAARANHDRAPFPWGGYYLRNKKGCYLANFSPVPQSMIKKDLTTGEVELDNKGFTNVGLGMNFPVPVKSYFPNDFGLYQMSGNVAEMLQEEGRTKGGSWRSSGYFITIDAEDEFENFKEASPMIGFRYFMEVIEE